MTQDWYTVHFTKDEWMVAQNAIRAHMGAEVSSSAHDVTSGLTALSKLEGAWVNPDCGPSRAETAAAIEHREAYLAAQATGEANEEMSYEDWIDSTDA